MLNVLLNLFFVAVLHMTVDGVAIATVISNAVSAALLFRRLLRCTAGHPPGAAASCASTAAACGRSCASACPPGVQSAVFAVSNIVIQSAINSLGTVVMAASSAAFNIEVFAY